MKKGVTIRWVCTRCTMPQEIDAGQVIIDRTEGDEVVSLGSVDMNCINCVGSAIRLRRQNAQAKTEALNARMDLERVYDDILDRLRAGRGRLATRREARWAFIDRPIIATLDWVINDITEQKEGR